MNYVSNKTGFSTHINTGWKLDTEKTAKFLRVDKIVPGLKGLPKVTPISASIDDSYIFSWNTDDINKIESVNANIGGSGKVGSGIVFNYSYDASDPEKGSKSISVGRSTGGGFEFHETASVYSAVTTSELTNSLTQATLQKVQVDIDEWKNSPIRAPRGGKW